MVPVSSSLASTGHGVLVVSHNLTDVFRVADRLAVLYLGRLVATGPAAEFDPQSVVDYMTTGTSARLGNGGNGAIAQPTASSGFGAGSEG